MGIGETFLSAFLQVLFEQLLEAGGIEFLNSFVGGVDLPKTFKEWKRQLTRLEALLDDAEQQQFQSESVRLWLNELKDLAYDIEDLLDHFATEAKVYNLKKAEANEANAAIDRSNAGILDTMMQNIYASGSRAAENLSTILKPVDQNIRDKIDEITERLEYIQQQSNSLMLTEAHMMQQRTLQTENLRRSHRESTSVVGKVFGRDDTKKEIITMLLKDDQNAEDHVVISIVGTGGIGKTTLAQYVYNDERVKDYFDLKAWVCISDDFDVKRITIDIINSATSENFDCSNLDQAQVKLQKELTGKKFFIVLDDIWSEEYDDWDKLQQPFQHGAKGSRVIMTTRNESIAWMMVTNPPQRNIIKLQSLSKDDSWRIFRQHANVHPDFTEMRDNIIEKINGLPLAAKALGGLLKSKPDKSERRKILESKVWGQKSRVLPVLRLSYHHMPSHLKHVFAYCSVFPKDYKFQEIELVLLWMAQGFLPETQNERMEDMGHKYFNDLVSRSLFEKVRFAPPFQEWFIMHDLIHDVAQLAAGDFYYVMDSKSDDLKRIRHLFITEHVQTLGKLIKAAQLRTFLCSIYYPRLDNLDIIQRMHYIRALHLVSNLIEVLPDCIGDLKHLRYLSLGFPRIIELPQSINCLLNLQTLCLDDCDKLEKVPYIGSLQELRHMYITDASMIKSLHKLFKQYPLKEMPLGIGKLTNLQTLGKFVLAPRGGSRVRELGKLNHLHGSLVIAGVEHVTEVEDAQEAQLHKKQSLDELVLEWGRCTDEVDDKTKRDVIEKLQPHTNINNCRLNGYMGSKFPSWLGDPSFSSMVAITLWSCDKCECLPPLGQLPSLKSLWVKNMNNIKEVGPEFYGKIHDKCECSSPFPSLKTLSMHYMTSWEKWVHPSVDNNKAFPILENLFISHCRSLQGDLPPYLPSLTNLEIHECRGLRTLELKDLSSSTSCIKSISVKRCESMVSIGHIPLTLESFEIDACKKLECVEFDDQPTNLSAESDVEKALQSGESIGVSPKASLEFPLRFQRFQFRIQSCPSLRSLQQSLLLPALRSFELRDCTNIHSLPEGGLPSNLTCLRIINVNIKQAIQGWGLHLLHSLKTLELKNVGSSVDSLECIPSPHLSLPSSLSSLELEGFQNLKSICYGTNLPNLTYINVKDCASLDSLVGDFTSLKDLSIEECPSLESLVSDFTSLIYLFIKNCPEFHNFPIGGLPTNLMRLSISETKIDKPIKEWGLHFLTSLEELTLENVGSCANTIESIGYQDFPSSLISLKIEGFQNLKTICCSTLPKLSDIDIKCCPKLESFGYNALPSHIKSVYIKECGMIEQHLRSDPNGRIRTKNGTFSLLIENQPSSAHSISGT